jgi:hypothetical protein
LVAVLIGGVAIREDIAFIIAAIVLLAERNRSDRWITKAVAALIGTGALIYGAVGTSYLLAPDPHPIGDRYSWLGSLLADPSFSEFAGVMSGYVLVTLLVVFFPLLFVPSALLRGTTGLAVLNSGMHIAAVFIPADSVYYQYHLPSVCLIAWSVASGRRTGPPSQLHEWGMGVAIVSLALAVSLGPLALVPPPVEVRDRWIPTLIDAQDRQAMAGLRELVPPDASVSASSTLVPVFAQRRLIYGFPDPLTCRARFTPSRGATSYPDYVALDHDRGEAEAGLLAELSYEPVGAAGAAVLYRAPAHKPRPERC